MARIAVFTCITEQYELPKTNQNWGKADWFLYTDSSLPVKKQDNNWNYTPVIEKFKDSRMTARFYKTIPHELFKDYDFSIWVDGSITFLITPEQLISQMLGYDIMTFKHPVRDCIYKEAEEILKLKLDYPDTVQKQMDCFKKKNYPEHNGLAETKIVVRKNTPAIANFNKEWLYQMLIGSERDQLSFNYIAWKLGFYIKYMTPFNKNPDFRQIHHKRKQYD
jgi:hypothetical protein